MASFMCHLPVVTNFRKKHQNIGLLLGAACRTWLNISWLVEITYQWNSGNGLYSNPGKDHNSIQKEEAAMVIWSIYHRTIQVFTQCESNQVLRIQTRNPWMEFDETNLMVHWISSVMSKLTDREMNNHKNSSAANRECNSWCSQALFKVLNS